MTDLTKIHKFEIYDGDAVVTFESTPEKERELVRRLLEWYSKNNAVTGESIFQSDRCQESACDFLADLADEVFEFDVDWVDE